MAPTPTEESFFGRRGSVAALIRCVPENLVRNKPTVARFLDEARLGALLHHPNITALLASGDGSTGEPPFLAYEYIVGPNLASLLDSEARRGGRVPLPVAARIAAEVLAALDAAHGATDASGASLNVVHRDVTPANVHIARDGRVKLAGFSASSHDVRSEQTGFGVLRGKLAYTAPESLSGAMDARADVFSCGVLLYELLTLARPFDRQSEFHTLKAIREEDPTPPSSVRTDLPPALDDLLRRALAKSPDDRFPSAVAMHRALEKAMGASGLAASGDVARYAMELAPPKLRQAMEAAPDDLVPVLEAVEGTPLGREEDEVPRSEPARREAAPLDTARVELPEVVEPAAPKARPAPRENVTAPSPLPEMQPEPRRSAPAMAPPTRPPTPEPSPPPVAPVLNPVPAQARPPLPAPPPAPARPPQPTPPPPLAAPKPIPLPARRPASGRAPAKRQRTFASRFRAPDERGLHPALQLAIIGLFFGAGLATVAARKRAAATSAQPLVALTAPRVEEPLDTDTQVTDDEPETPPPTLGPTPLGREQRLAHGDGRRSAEASADTAANPSTRGGRLGRLVVESNPPAAVVVDEKERGMTPLSLRIASGTHALTVVGPQGLTKRFRIEVPPGRQVKKVVTFPFTPPQPSKSSWP